VSDRFGCFLGFGFKQLLPNGIAPLNCFYQNVGRKLQNLHRPQGKTFVEVFEREI